jgi:hypothetical protein
MRQTARTRYQLSTNTKKISLNGREIITGGIRRAPSPGVGKAGQCGASNIAGRLRFAPRGSRLTAPKGQRTKSAYIFCAICLATTQHRGHTVASCLSFVPGSAGCPCRANHRPRRKHIIGKLISRSNITLLPLPPELNPVKTIWQFIRDSCLSSRIFGSYDEIIALCCEIRNKRIAQSWKIMPIGRRKSAYGF